MVNRLTEASVLRYPPRLIDLKKRPNEPNRAHRRAHSIEPTAGIIARSATGEPTTGVVVESAANEPTAVGEPGGYLCVWE